MVLRRRLPCRCVLPRGARLGRKQQLLRPKHRFDLGKDPRQPAGPCAFASLVRDEILADFYPGIHQPAHLAVHGNRVVGLVADRIGLVVADHEIGFRAQELQQERRQDRVAMIERADVPGPRDAGVSRRKAVQRHQHRRQPVAQATVDDLLDAPVIGIEDGLPPRFRGFARQSFIARYRGGVADQRDRACGMRRAVAVDHQPRIALRDQMRVELFRQRLRDAGNADVPGDVPRQFLRCEAERRRAAWGSAARNGRMSAETANGRQNCTREQAEHPALRR